MDTELQLHLATFFLVLHATNLIFQMEKRWVWVQGFYEFAAAILRQQQLSRGSSSYAKTTAADHCVKTTVCSMSYAMAATAILQQQLSWDSSSYAMAAAAADHCATTTVWHPQPQCVKHTLCPLCDNHILTRLLGPELQKYDLLSKR